MTLPPACSYGTTPSPGSHMLALRLSVLLEVTSQSHAHAR